MTMDAPHRASCLCGAVQLVVTSELISSSFCHCTQCRKQSGHHWASANVSKRAVSISGEEHLSDFHASEKVRRRFCRECGTWLIWEHEDEEDCSISLGCFDTPTGITVARNIFVETKGDYYTLPEENPAP